MPLLVHASTHDARLLRYTSLFKNNLNEDAIPYKHIELGNFGTVLLVTVEDNTFPKFAWLLKSYDEKTKDHQHRFLTSACVAHML